MENEHSALEGLNFMTLTQSVQSYEPDFSDDYLGNFYLETPEVNSEPITEAATEKPRFAPPVTDAEIQELTESQAKIKIHTATSI